jgi:hypothetical protein
MKCPYCGRQTLAGKSTPTEQQAIVDLDKHVLLVGLSVAVQRRDEMRAKSA